MAIVTGVLADFSRAALSNSSVNRQPVIEFIPSGNAVKPDGSVVYATRTITTIPTLSTGAWTVDLESTDDVSPDVYYNVAITWLDSAGNFISKDWLPWRMYVPHDGGLFTDLIRDGASVLQVWVSADGVIPADAKPLDFLFDPISNDLYRLS